MEIHDNLVIHPVTLIFPSFSKDRACANLVGKSIPLLVVYLPLVAFLCEDHFLTGGFSVDYCAGGLCTQSHSYSVLEVTTTGSGLGVATTIQSCSNKECTWSCSRCLESSQKRVHLELQ